MRPLVLCVLVLAGCDAAIEAPDAVPGKPPPVQLPAPAEPPFVAVTGMPVIDTFACTPEAGYAPLISTCAFAISHSQQKTNRCTLSVNDGRANPADAVDCAALGDTDFQFAVPGTYVVTLKVIDAVGTTVQQLKTFTVTEKPNTAPVVTSFTAAPAMGTAPLNTTFTWAVSDPDGDAVTCAIDVGNDGSFEYPAVDCASAAGQAHGFTAPGAVEVLFVVKDPKGLMAQQVVLVTARAPVGDVRIARVEWAQAIVLENLRLVQGKAALIRIHVLGDKAGLTGVVVDAEGFSAAGASLGKLTLVGPASPPVAIAANTLAQQWTATVPAAWVEANFEVRIKLDPADALPETDETNNALVSKPVVGAGNVLQLTSVPVVHQGQTAGVIDIQPIMTRMMPVKAIANTTRAPYTFSGTLLAGDTNGWGQLLQNIAGVRQSDGSNRNYYGFVRVAYGSGIAGIGYIGQEAATGRDDSDDTAAHELGHNLGRNHAPCGGAAGADANFPYAGAKIGSWGYDAVTKQLLNPATYVDLMSYCNPAWISDYTYRAVQTRLETAAYVPPQGPAMYAPVVLVAGIIKNGKDVTLQPVQRMIAARSRPGDGAWAVRLVTADGAPKLYAFTPDEVADAEEGEHHFTLTLPDPGALVAVEVLRGAEVVQRQVATGQAVPVPQLTRVAPDALRLQWDASVFRTAEVAHFAEDGTRTTLGLWLTKGDALIQTGALGPGRYEVSVSDGVLAERRVVLADR